MNAIELNDRLLPTLPPSWRKPGLLQQAAREHAAKAGGRAADRPASSLGAEDVVLAT